MNTNTEKSKTKKWLGTLIKFAVSAVLLIILIISTDIKEIGNALAGFKLIWLIPVLLTITLSMVVSALKWGVLLKAQGVSVSVFSLFCYYVCGLFFNNFLPSSIGGDGARAILAGRKSGSVSGAAASVVMERILATVTLSVLGLLGAVFAKNTVPLVIILMSVLLAVGILLALIQMTGWVPKRLKDSDKKIASVWKSFAQNSAAIRKAPKAIAVCLLESLVFQFLVALVVAGVMAGMGLPLLPLADLCMVVSASSVLAMVPIGLNGYGLREGSYAFLLAPYGYSTAQALTISVLYALFVTLFSLAGGPIWLVMKPDSDKNRDEKEEKENENENRKLTVIGRKKIIYMLAVIIAAALLFIIPASRNAVFSVMKMLGSADVEAVKAYILSFGPLAVVISIMLMILQSIAAPIPALLITFANAAVFGWIAGSIISWTGAMLGAAVCFGLARLFGRDAVVKITGKGALQSVDRFFVAYGAKSIFIARLLPFIPFDPISYAAGLTGMGFIPFLIATGIGQLPATLIYSYAGSTMLSGNIRMFMYGLCALLAAGAVSMILHNIYINKKEAADKQKKDLDASD